jgi:transposase-like protein DUF772
VPAEVIATVMVLQALEGLSDREAISALRRDIAWKVACGLRLDDEGFPKPHAGVVQAELFHVGQAGVGADHRLDVDGPNRALREP